MLLIPTIVLRNGDQTGTGKSGADEPAQLAARWVKAGAQRLHVANMNGTATGKAAATDVIRAITQTCPGIPMQVSGGVRDEQAVEQYLTAGAEYVVLDAKAASAPHFVNDLCLEYPGHILVTLETRSGKVAAEGWSKLGQHSVTDVAQHFQREGVAAIVHHTADGQGQLDFNTAQSLAQTLTIPVLVMGGLTSVAMLAELCQNGSALGGAILDAGFAAGQQEFGKALRLAGQQPVAE